MRTVTTVDITVTTVRARAARVLFAGLLCALSRHKYCRLLTRALPFSACAFDIQIKYKFKNLEPTLTIRLQLNPDFDRGYPRSEFRIHAHVRQCGVRTGRASIAMTDLSCRTGTSLRLSCAHIAPRRPVPWEAHHSRGTVRPHTCSTASFKLVDFTII